MTRKPIVLFPLLLLAACSSAPKPRELDTYEGLQRNANMAAAQKRAPNLVGDAERLYARSNEEWASNNLYESRRDALMATIKLKTALALVDQDRAKARITAADGGFLKTEEELARVSKDLAQTEEQVRLLEKLGQTQTAARTASEKLSEEQQRSAAQAKIGAAQLSIKNAEQVAAPEYAKAEYTAAQDLLTKAQTDLKNGNIAAAATSAELAKSKAEQATIVARPSYQQAEQSKENKARDEALSREAAAIPGVTVRLERMGQMQRLVLPLRNLFVKKKTTPVTTNLGMIDQVAELLKKYPTYPVQIVGHTDNRGKADALLALSQARAQAVYELLVARGVDPKRFVVSGKGGEEPVTDNKTASGRAQNQRVEVVFLYP